MTTTAPLVTPTGLLVLADGADRTDWLAARSRGIGSSDAAAVLGLDPWKDPLALFLDKTGALEDLGESSAMRWGQLLEGPIADAFADQEGYVVGPTPGVLAHVDRPWMLANPDRMLLDPDGLPWSFVECKNVSGWKSDGWDVEAGVMPPHYFVQVQHQLSVMGYDTGYVAALVGGNDLRSLTVHADPGFAEDLIDREWAFWQRVLAGDAPDYQGVESSVDAMRRVRRASKEVEVADPVDARDLYARIAAVKAEKSALAREVKAVEAREKLLIGEALVLLGDGDVATVDGVPLFTYKQTHRKASAATTYRTFRLA